MIKNVNASSSKAQELPYDWGTLEPFTYTASLNKTQSASHLSR